MKGSWSRAERYISIHLYVDTFVYLAVHASLHGRVVRKAKLCTRRICRSLLLFIIMLISVISCCSCYESLSFSIALIIFIIDGKPLLFVSNYIPIDIGLQCMLFTFMFHVSCSVLLFVVMNSISMTWLLFSLCFRCGQPSKSILVDFRGSTELVYNAIIILNIVLGLGYVLHYSVDDNIKLHICKSIRGRLDQQLWGECKQSCKCQSITPGPTFIA